MVRNYQKKGLRAKWNEEEMQRAVDAVKNGQSLRAAARLFKVPRNTLRRHANNAGPVQKKLGRKPILTMGQELELRDLILEFERSLYGLTRSDVRELVFQYCEKNQILNPFSQGKAGREWIDGFLKRHTDLTVR
jgi:transposase-like protein